MCLFDGDIKNTKEARHTEEMTCFTQKPSKGEPNQAPLRTTQNNSARIGLEQMLSSSSTPSSSSPHPQAFAQRSLTPPLQQSSLSLGADGPPSLSALDSSDRW
jgi:hypothetical protein